MLLLCMYRQSEILLVFWLGRNWYSRWQVGRVILFSIVQFQLWNRMWWLLGFLMMVFRYLCNWFMVLQSRIFFILLFCSEEMMVKFLVWVVLICVVCVVLISLQVGYLCYCMLYIGFRLLVLVWNGLVSQLVFLLVFWFQILQFSVWKLVVLWVVCRKLYSLFIIDLKVRCLVVIVGKFFCRLKCIMVLGMFRVWMLVWLFCQELLVSMFWMRFWYCFIVMFGRLVGRLKDGGLQFIDGLNIGQWNSLLLQ